MNNDLNTNKKLYNPDELGEFLNISKTTVYRLKEGRKIPFYKINGQIRFAEKDILEFLENNRIESIN